ncbi:MAG: hypothetical protein ILP11_01215, partial [Alphaproteobacteria bacterium]|nr:hypothetical protein [Alphaproteobacteria bacterium]
MTENNIKEIQSCIRKNAIGVSAEIQSCIRKNAIGVSATVGLIGGILLANISTTTSQVRDLKKSVDEIKATLAAQ